MKYFLGLLANLLVLSLCGPSYADSIVNKLPSLLIISVDGLRPDVLLRAQMPATRELMQEGSFSFYVRTTDMAVTLPSHTSMLTGVPPEKHGIVWNDDRVVKDANLPSALTIFQIAKSQGVSTALVAGKSKFGMFAKSNALDWQVINSSKVAETDSSIALQAVNLITKHHPRLLFVHLPRVDIAGHDNGWGSEEQLKAAAEADSQIKKIISAFYSNSDKENHFVILSTDHGGAQRGHGADSVPSRYIPIVINGPGIRKNFDLTLTSGNIAIEDIFATACHILKLKIPEGIQGKVIYSAFSKE